MAHPATFQGEPGFAGMNTFLKVLGLLVLAVIAIKLAPLVLLPVIVLLAVLFAAGLAVAGGITLALIVALAVVAALAPIWLPVALLAGLVMLICRLVRGRA